MTEIKYFGRFGKIACGNLLVGFTRMQLAGRRVIRQKRILHRSEAMSRWKFCSNWRIYSLIGGFFKILLKALAL